MQDITNLLDIARRAGDAILAVRSSGAFATRAKDDRSPLTAADLAADTIISEGLAACDPGTPVLSEESAQAPWSARSAWRRSWCVDPLDGTKEFLGGGDDFTVNIALLEEGAPVLGVVLAPALGRAWWGGSAAGGSWRDGTPIRCRTRPAGAPWRVVASKSHAGPETEAWLAALGPHERVAMGSSLKICLVADGGADLYPRLGPTMAWDTAAAHAVLLGAGGDLVDPHGASLRYHREDLRNPIFLARGTPITGLPALLG